jgi:hypothetical protein
MINKSYCGPVDWLDEQWFDASAMPKYRLTDGHNLIMFISKSSQFQTHLIKSDKDKYPKYVECILNCKYCATHDKQPRYRCNIVVNNIQHMFEFGEALYKRLVVVSKSTKLLNVPIDIIVDRNDKKNYYRIVVESL